MYEPGRSSATADRVRPAAVVTDPPRRPRVAMKLAGIALLVLVSLAILTGIWKTRSEAHLAAQLEAIEDDGLPITAAELEQFYVVPPADEDATQLWLDAIAAMQSVKGLPKEGYDLVLTFAPWEESWSATPLAEQVLTAYRSSLKQLHKAAAHGGTARYPVSYNQGFAGLSRLHFLRAAARLAALEASVLAHRGDYSGALRSIETALAVGDSLEPEPIGASQLVRMACYDDARRILVQLLPQLSLAGDDLARLQHRWEQIDYQPGFERGLIGDRVLGMLYIDEPQKLAGVGMIRLPRHIELAWPLLRPRVVQLHLEHTQRAIEAAPLPLPQALAAARQIEAEMELAAADTVGGQELLESSLFGLLRIEDSFKATAKAHADNQMAATAVAIERHKRQHGVLPQHLGELVPEFMKTIPLDPFNGQPLKYVRGENGYILYNVGEDGIDNGGIGDESTLKPDDVLRIEYPQATGESSIAQDHRHPETEIRRLRR